MITFNNFFAMLYTIPLEQAALISLIGNAVMFAAALIAGEVIVRAFHDRANAETPPPLSRQEVVLSVICVVLNALVAVAGIVLWRAGVIRLREDAGFLAVVLDTLLLIVLMDLGMYVF